MMIVKTTVRTYECEFVEVHMDDETTDPHLILKNRHLPNGEIEAEHVIFPVEATIYRDDQPVITNMLEVPEHWMAEPSKEPRP